MRTRSLICLVLLVTLSGCIVTYRDFPNATLESLPKNHEPKPLYYHVEPMAGTILVLIPSLYPQFPQIDPIGQPGYHQVAQTLESSGLFSALIVVPDLPETGVYCSIDFEERMPSALWTGADLRGAFFIVLGLLPYYTGGGRNNRCLHPVPRWSTHADLSLSYHQERRRVDRATSLRLAELLHQRSERCGARSHASIPH